MNIFTIFKNYSRKILLNSFHDFSSILDTSGRPIIRKRTELQEESDSAMDRLWNGDRRMPVFGYTVETLQMLMVPMLKTKKEALGSMGN